MKIWVILATVWAIVATALHFFPKEDAEAASRAEVATTAPVAEPLPEPEVIDLAEVDRRIYEEKVAELEAKIAERETVEETDTAREIDLDRDSEVFTQMTEMMENEAMISMVRAQQRGMVEQLYGGLFERFRLNQEEQEYFRDLLVEKKMHEAGLGLQMMKVMGDEKQRDALMKTFEENVDATNAAIREFLNSEDDFATFERYEAMEDERFLTQMVAGAGVDFAPEAQARLTEVMYEVRISDELLNRLANPTAIEPELFSGAGADAIYEHSIRANEKVRERAAEFLTAEQMEALEKQQKAMAEMMQSQLEMAGNMFQVDEESE